MYRPRLLLVAATIACLAPWIHRAVHVDDPLFLWSAERILANPWDFYGGDVTWGDQTTRLVDEMQNPPLHGYYLAAVARVTGFGEVPLHLAMLVPTIAAVLATAAIARRLGAHPLLSGAILIASPVFLVSSTSLMCDVPMLALWLTSLALWLRGIDEHSIPALALAGLLMGACGLTKYFGVALLPLTLVYGLCQRRSVGWWCLWLLLPLGMFAAFEFYAVATYGRRLMLGAAGYAFSAAGQQPLSWWGRGLLTLVYAGAGVAPLLFWMPWLWSRWVNLAWIAGGVALGGLLAALGEIGGLPLRSPAGIEWSPLLHLTVFATVGAQILGLTLVAVWRRRDAHAVLLGLWVLGTLVFCAWFNWTINGRAILPLAPAVAILVARQVMPSGEALAALPALRAGWLIPWSAGLALSLMLCWSDYWTAAAERTAAEALAAEHVEARGRAHVLFEGHWGFQYYLERQGLRCIDYGGNTTIAPGDVVLVQNANPATTVISGSWINMDTLEVPVARWWTTHSLPLKTSLYSELLGPLPYRFGPVPPAGYRVFLPTQAERFSLPSAAETDQHPPS